MIGLMHKKINELDEMATNYELVINTYEGLYDKDEEDFDLLKIIEECFEDVIKFSIQNDNEKASAFIKKCLKFYEIGYFNNPELFQNKSEYFAVLYKRLRNVFDYGSFMLTINKDEGMSVLKDVIERLEVLKAYKEFKFNELLNLCHKMVNSDNSIVLNNLDKDCKSAIQKILNKLELVSPKKDLKAINNTLDVLVDFYMTKLRAEENLLDDGFINIFSTINSELIKFDRKDLALKLNTLILTLFEFAKIYRRFDNGFEEIFTNNLSMLIGMGIPSYNLSDLLKRYFIFCTNDYKQADAVSLDIFIQKQFILSFYTLLCSKYENKNLLNYFKARLYKSNNNNLNDKLFWNTMILKTTLKFSQKNRYAKADAIFFKIFDKESKISYQLHSDVGENIKINLIPMTIFLSILIDMNKSKLDTLYKLSIQYKKMNDILTIKRYYKKVYKYIEKIGLIINVSNNISNKITSFDFEGLNFPVNFNNLFNPLSQELNLLNIKFSIFAKRIGFDKEFMLKENIYQGLQEILSEEDLNDSMRKELNFLNQEFIKYFNNI
jgi:hypothetical protein